VVSPFNGLHAHAPLLFVLQSLSGTQTLKPDDHWNHKQNDMVDAVVIPLGCERKASSLHSSSLHGSGKSGQFARRSPRRRLNYVRGPAGEQHCGGRNGLTSDAAAAFCKPLLTQQVRDTLSMRLFLFIRVCSLTAR
jgi:hypothetical protein